MFRNLKRRTICDRFADVFLASPVPGRAQESLLERDVLPILTKQCLGCHGGLRQKGGLDMRTIPADAQRRQIGARIESGRCRRQRDVEANCHG